MFNSRFFNPQYWAGSYWPKVGGEIIKPSGYLCGVISVSSSLNGQIDAQPALNETTSISSALNGEINVRN